MKNCINCPDLARDSLKIAGLQCFEPGCPKQKKFELIVVNLVNSERKKLGLKPLLVDSGLTRAARAKSIDMANRNYFSHWSPTYGTPAELIKKFGVSCTLSGENIASGYPGPKIVFKEWMESPGHRLNILEASFTAIGVGYFFTRLGEFHHYWAQEFAKIKN